MAIGTGIGITNVVPLAPPNRAADAGPARTAETEDEEVAAVSPITDSIDPQTADAIRALETLTEGSGIASDGPEQLTEEQQQVVQDLREQDQEVRAHEQAHKNVAGPYAGPISYETVTGPDGREYAVAGSVDIDVSPEGSPEQTIRKADIVIRAALAPANPSPEDFSVARAAQQLRAQAQQELSAQQQEAQEAQSESEPTIIEELTEDAQTDSNTQNPNSREDNSAAGNAARQSAEILVAIQNLAEAAQLAS